MPIVTLTTDWHKADYYAGALKGQILSKAPKAQVVELTHQIQHFNPAQAAFVLRSAYRHFPDGTVHLICVNSEAPQGKSNIACLFDNQYFIGADNGVFALFMDKPPQQIVRLSQDLQFAESFASFPEIGYFAPAAAHLAQGKPISELGEAQTEVERQINLMPTIDENSMNGRVIYIDSYKNAITNISRQTFDRVAKGRNFVILVQSNFNRITKINRYYRETPEGELLALFNSASLLEIAINKGNAAELLDLSTSSSIIIKFK